MNCPKCHSNMTKVYKSRRVTKYKTRRYKVCLHCGKNFSSTEKVDPPKEKKDPGDDIYIIPDDDK